MTTSHRSIRPSFLPMPILLLSFTFAACGDEAVSPPNDPAAVADSGVDPALEARVRAAASALYVHGMTKDLALEVAGYEAVPVLRTLLADPTFPRHDNVVMLLGFLGEEEDLRALVDYFENRDIEWGNPEHERALHLVPQMLGHAASDGNAFALRYLMDASADGQVLVDRAAGSPDSARQLDRLMANVFTGLANSSDPVARARLIDLATGDVAPLGGDYANVIVDATLAVERFDFILAGDTPQPDHGMWEDGSQFGDVKPPPQTAGAPPLDTNNTVHMHGMDISNHTNMFNKITDSRADEITNSASETIGTGNYNDDVVCCNMMERDLAVNNFGSNNDGLDTIDNNNELNQVIPGFGRRVKMVDQINYCGGFGTGILGCSWVGGMGMAQVRMGQLRDEGMLWAHEYGHNIGLNHVSDSRNVMYAFLTGGNYVVTQSQCNTYHNPNFGADADKSNFGSCTDTDNDDVHDVLQGGAGFGVNITGPCPGQVTISITGGTPFGDFTAFTANLEGFDDVNTGSCTNVQSGLWNPIERGNFTMDANGSLTLRPNVGAGLCSDFAQLVDLTTCEITGVAQFPN